MVQLGGVAAALVAGKRVIAKAAEEKTKSTPPRALAMPSPNQSKEQSSRPALRVDSHPL
jgi:hypothetical protein